jgi:hypothetical protein
MTRHDLEVTARRLSSLFDDLIGVWIDLESIRKQLEELQREDPPTPPQQQPIEDLRIVARYVRDREVYDQNLDSTLHRKRQFESAYEDLVTEIKELIPDDISIIHSYQGPGRPDLRGKNLIIEIHGDSISIQSQEQ